MKEYNDLTNKKYGEWTVLYEAEPDIYNGRRVRRWFCQCSCGTTRSVKEKSLIAGTSKSCGCLHSKIMKDVCRKNMTTHGMTNTRLYRIFKHMHNRCNNKNDNRYDLYGGRGIKVCDEWSSFETFAKWSFENGYEENLSIDRIDVDKDYSPDNCRWADVHTQANNKRNVVVYTYNNESHTISEWANLIGINYKTLWKRLKQFKWPIEKALEVSP